MLSEFLLTKIEKEDIGNIWFQQDGALCHTAEATHDDRLTEDADFDKKNHLFR